MRIYNPNLGKFLSVDPLTDEYPELTPYQFASNSPIWGIDRDGEELQIATAALGGLVDYLGQVADNYASEKKNPWIDNIDLVSIAASAADGFLKSGASIGRKILVKVTTTLIKNAVEIKTTEKGIKAKVETNVKTIVKNTATDLVTDKVLGGAASKGAKVVKKVLTKSNINGGTIAKATKKILNNVNVDVTRKLNNVIENATKDVVEKVADKAITKVLEKVSEPLVEHIKAENSIESKKVEIGGEKQPEIPVERKYWMPSDGTMYNANKKP